MNTPDPIWHILHVFDQHQVQCLLMGGQACILYGAAEFSKDIDFAFLTDDDNMVSLEEALAELKAEVIAVPRFEKRWLEAGLAVHFRCHSPPAAGFRIDLMSRMRGVDDFANLWARKNIFDLAPGLTVSVLSLRDLVATKKTQRAKDWPMLRRLVEVDYFSHQDNPQRSAIEFWLLELRDPDLLMEAANLYAGEAERLSLSRPLLTDAMNGRSMELRQAIEDEEHIIRQTDHAYWAPLRKMLEELRHRNSKES